VSRILKKSPFVDELNSILSELLKIEGEYKTVKERQGALFEKIRENLRQRSDVDGLLLSENSWLRKKAVKIEAEHTGRYGATKESDEQGSERLDLMVLPLPKPEYIQWVDA
jgi:hypothetical protein